MKIFFNKINWLKLPIWSASLFCFLLVFSLAPQKVYSDDATPGSSTSTSDKNYSFDVKISQFKYNPLYLRNHLIDRIFLKPFDTDLLMGANWIAYRKRWFPDREISNTESLLKGQLFPRLTTNCSLVELIFGYPPYAGTYECIIIIHGDEHDKIQALVLNQTAANIYRDSMKYRFSDAHLRLEWLNQYPRLCQERFKLYVGILKPDATPIQLRQYLHSLDASIFTQQLLVRNAFEDSFFNQNACVIPKKGQNTRGHTAESTRNTSPHQSTSRKLLPKELKAYEISETANKEAYPASMHGPTSQVLGATSTYSMKLDTGPDHKESLPNDDVYYQFTVYNITALIQKGLTTTSAAETIENPPEVLEKAPVEGTSPLTRDLARRLENFKEDSSNAAKQWGEGYLNATSRPILDTLKDIIVGGLNLSLTPASVVVSVGGFFVSNLINWASGESFEHTIALPKKEGFYLIRGLATPKRRGAILRATSVASLVVEVRSAAYWAKNALLVSAAQAAELDLEEALSSSPESQAIISQKRQTFTLQNQALPLLLIQSSLNQAQREFNLLKSGNVSKEKIKVALDKVESLEKVLSVAQKHQAELPGDVFRVSAAIASEENGTIFQPLLQMECHPQDPPKIKCKLSDVTSFHNAAFYEESGKDEEEAVWKVLKSFAEHAAYGRGAIAFALPVGKMPLVKMRTRVFRLAPVSTAILKDRIGDLTIVLTALSLMVPVAGQAAIFLGGGLSAARLYNRIKSHSLSSLKEWDLEASLDSLMVLAAISSTLGSLGRFVQVKFGDSFALATEGSQLAKISTALKAFDTGANTATFVFAAGGIAVGNIQLLSQLKSLNEKEASGDISHSEARIARAHLYLNALFSNALFIQGLRNSKNNFNAKEGLLANVKPTTQAKTTEVQQPPSKEVTGTPYQRAQTPPAGKPQAAAALTSEFLALEQAPTNAAVSEPGNQSGEIKNQPTATPTKPIDNLPISDSPDRPKTDASKPSAPSTENASSSTKLTPKDEPPPKPQKGVSEALPSPKEPSAQTADLKQEKLRLLDLLEPTITSQTAKEEYLKGIEEHPLMKSPNDMTYTLHAELTPQESEYIKPILDKIRFLEAWAEIRVRSGKANPENASAKTLLITPKTSSTYAMAYGKAVHSETFYLIKQSQKSYFLPKEIVTDSGIPNLDKELPTSYGKKRPDIRIPLGNGKEGILDLTTKKQKNHAKKYIIPKTAVVVEHYYK